MKAALTAAQQAERRLDRATRWFIHLRDGEVSARQLKAWQSWLSAPENRQVFDEVTRLWSTVGQASRPDALITMGTRNRAVVPRARRYGYIGIAATVLLMIGIGVLTADRWYPWVSGAHVAVLQTKVAENRQFVLNDGSRIDLGAKTSVSTTMSAHFRTAILNSGEALFQVARDPRRPFSVIAGGGKITAIGTVFNVRKREDNHVVVTVTEGTVEIAGSTVRRLEQGQQVSYDADGRFSEPLTADNAIAPTWRDGQLQYRREPLRNVLPDVNRYSRRQVVLGDRAAGELPYTGTVFEETVDEWIDRIGTLYPQLEVTATDAENVLVRTRPVLPKE